MGIGNENCAHPNPDQYAANYLRIARAVRAAHPSLPLVLGCETQEAMSKILAAQPGIREVCDMYDVHQRKSPSEFVAAAHEFDTYPRSGAPKLFVSEYSSPRSLFPNSTTLRAAVAEALYMAGMEANGDVVEIATYGDLMQNANDATGSSGISTIIIDSNSSVGTPSWAVQQAFMLHQPVALVPSSLQCGSGAVDQQSSSPSSSSMSSSSPWPNGNGGTCSGNSVHNDEGSDDDGTMLAASVSTSTTGDIQAKLVNYGPDAVMVTVNLLHQHQEAFSSSPGSGDAAQLVTVTSKDGSPDAVNSFDAPPEVAMTRRVVTMSPNGTVSLTLPSWSVNVLKVATTS